MLKETLPEQHSEYIPTLDGWRGIAILLVLIQHGFFSHAQAFAHNSSWKRVLHATIDHSGPAGVILFFAISGFLICTRLLSHRALHARISLSDFYIRRCFRIIPPALVYLLVIAVLVLSGMFTRMSSAPFAWRDWYSAALFFLNYNMGRHTWVIGHYWSLAVEEQFYLFWPGVLVLLGNRGASIAAMLTAMGAIAWRLFWILKVPLANQAHLLERTDIRLDSFMWPCFFAICLTSQNGRWVAGYLGRQPLQAILIAMLAVISLGGQIFYAGVFLEKMFVPLFIALLVVSTVMNPSGWLGKILEVRGLRWIGRLSYSVYLWQQIVIFDQAAHSRLRIMVLLFCLKLPLILGLALASYYWIEVPFIRIGRRLAGRVSGRLSRVSAVAAS
jgi:peptidoglycan/LPS O-acetylase OafA/YrhL